MSKDNINYLSLRILRTTNFSDIYKKLLVNTDKNGAEYYQLILSLAVLLINSNNREVQRLGYRIIVFYCNQTGDYKPLYEVAINLGLLPIAKVIYERQIISDVEVSGSSLFLEFNDLYTKTYEKNGKFSTLEQYELSNFFNVNIDKTAAIIAPTSYGKTDMVLSLIKKRSDSSICIVTPTKSLLAQTKQRIMKAGIKGVQKIITHPEMYVGTETRIVAVLTQERLLRLLRADPKLCFDYIVIDEAHNVLGSNSRSELLAVVIIVAKKRKSTTKFKFLTPFLVNVENIKVKFTDLSIQNFPVQEYIKSEKFFMYDPELSEFELYDQFMDKFYALENIGFLDEVSFVEKYCCAKNIIYLNKPKDAESFARELSYKRDKLDSGEIKKACKALADYIHPEYSLIRLLGKGVIYHHGAVPDSVRLYIEYLYSEVSGLTHVVTTSTLLEGINLPAERMFILHYYKGNKKLTSSDFRNLVGRICRFNDIFSKQGDLRKLEPHIYILKSKYVRKDANMKNFLSEVAKVDKKIKDDPQNVLLETVNIDEDDKQKKYENALEFIENYEENSIPDYNFRRVKTEVGKVIFTNNIVEISVFDIEVDLQKQVDDLRNENLYIDDAGTLINKMNDLFFSYLPQKHENANMARLKNETAQKFYAMFLDWRIKGASYSEMINSFLKHWEAADDLVYVGRWGEEKRDGHIPLWVDINKKDLQERINLAIVRIKEEQEFFDNYIIKFVEAIHDLNFLEKSFYHRIKYGTDNEETIILVKNGVSLNLSNRVVSKYGKHVKINRYKSTIYFYETLLSAMETNQENEVLINEARYHVNVTN